MQILLIIAWLFQAGWLGWTLLATPIHFGFASALAFAVWLAVGVYAVEKLFYPALRLHWVLLASVLFSTALTIIFPGQVLHPGVSAWLPLHSIFGMAAYACFALAVFHAWQLSCREAQVRRALGGEKGLPLLTLERLMFNFVIAGFVLLTITLILGLGFREVLYGPHHLWRWEHKTVFAMLSWLVFAILLFGRYALGWRGQRAVRWVYAGALFMLLSYIGSRFVLEVVLHKNV